MREAQQIKYICSVADFSLWLLEHVLHLLLSLNCH